MVIVGVECLEKGEQYNINKTIELEPKGFIYEIKLIVYYEDVLTNWYKQEVEINYLASSIISSGHNLEAVDFKVKNEMLIKESDIPTFG